MATIPTAWSPLEATHGGPGASILRIQRSTIERYVLTHLAATALVAATSALLAAGLTPSVTESSVVFTLCVGWILFSWARFARAVISPYWMFALVASLFNGGQALLQIFGANPNGVLQSRFSDVTTSSAIVYSSLCMMLLHCGALWRLTRRRRTAEPASHDLESGAVWLGIVLILISAIPMYLQLRANLVDVLNVGYFGLYQREVLTNVDNWRSLLAQFMLPGIFLLAATSQARPAFRWISLVLILIYALAYLFMGYRGAAGASIAAYGWIWHSRVRKLPLYPTLAAGTAVVFLLFPMIRLHRSTRGEDRLSWSGFMGTLDNYDNPAAASLTEMGGTLATTAYTMDLVPGDRDFEYGKGYFFAALTVVPNIFGTARHPSVERGTASDWLVHTVSYHNASSGGGLGYSFVAEAYLNFGWMGPPLVMILLGYALAAAECFAAVSASPAACSLMGVILFFGLIYTRAETTDIVRPIVWCGFLPLAALSLFIAQKKLWRSSIPLGLTRFPRRLPQAEISDSD